MHKTTNAICPHCKLPLDRATGATGATDGDYPKQGDISICTSCGTFSWFTLDNHLIEITDAEFVDLPAEIRSKLNDTRKEIVQAQQSEANALVIWTIYVKPKDFPNKFVARKWICLRNAHAPIPTEHVLTDDTIEALREELAVMGLNQLMRSKFDDSVIAECWL